MAHLTEDDYKELLNHILDKLEELSADSIIQRIQELKTVSVAEKSKEKRGRKKEASHDGSLEQLLIRLPEKEASQYHFRTLSGQELYAAALEMMESYLIFGPEMARKTKTILPDGSWDNIAPERVVWKYDGGRQDGEQNLEDPLEKLDRVSPGELAEMREIIETLKKTIG